ncbi:hypothetical protein ACEXQD_17805 [Herbiconiux sp. P15]|uniref:hypothetical protein n=1 Tax=Herbiconiux liukaitaii TaxID=3342799 RepID=UPI0035B8027D
MTTVSSRRAVLRFSTAGGVATFLSSFFSIQAVVAISAKVDLGFSGSFVLLGAQIALLLAVCSALGAALGWRNGARLMPTRAGAVLVGVAASLFVVVAAIVTTVALVPELWVVLWIVTVPAIAGGLAAAFSVRRLQREREGDSAPATSPRLSTLTEFVLDRLRAPDEVLLHDPRPRRVAARRAG